MCDPCRGERHLPRRCWPERSQAKQLRATRGPQPTVTENTPRARVHTDDTSPQDTSGAGALLAAPPVCAGGSQMASPAQPSSLSKTRCDAYLPVWHHHKHRTLVIPSSHPICSPPLVRTHSRNLGVSQPSLPLPSPGRADAITVNSPHTISQVPTPHTTGSLLGT